MMNVIRVTVASVVLGLAAAECQSFTSCDKCTGDPTCGWCNDVVILNDGSYAGFQCAPRDASLNYTCLSDLGFHWDTCDGGFTCDFDLGTCSPAPSGQGMKNATCTETCEAYGNKTEAFLVGLWRGVDVQSGFARDEVLFNFTSTEAWWYTSATATWQHSSIVGSGQSSLRFTDPTSKATQFYATYSPGMPYPFGPETYSMTLAAGAGDQKPGSYLPDAMGNTAIATNVWVLHKCLGTDFGGMDLCDFAGAFDRTPGALPALTSPRNEDACNNQLDCESCMSFAGYGCGWCEGTVVNGDLTPGCGGKSGCCTGQAAAHCTDTYDHTCPLSVYCDWETNPEAPTCADATEGTDDGRAVYANCNQAKIQGCVWGYYCSSEGTCKVAENQTVCEDDPDCDPTKRVCDAYDTCKSTGLSAMVGDWRGIELSSSFVSGEYDVSVAVLDDVNTTASIAISGPAGYAFSGTLKLGASASNETFAASMTFTATSDDGSTTLAGIVSANPSTPGPVTKFMYLAFGETTAPKNFNSAMVGTDNYEFVLMACLDTLSSGQCNFSV